MVRDEEMEEWIRILTSGKLRPMTEEEYKASGLREVSSPSPAPAEPEYVFDDGSSPFEDVNNKAFNGLVDGAGEFPLWEDDSHK